MSARIYLADDGTLDTVLRCADCGEEFRFNYANAATDGEDEDDYEEWLDHIIRETADEHDCPRDLPTRKLTQQDRMEAAADAGIDTWADYREEK
jgi:hypothetical protein